jgi:hypothetical protein
VLYFILQGLHSNRLNPESFFFSYPSFVVSITSLSGGFQRDSLLRKIWELQSQVRAELSGQMCVYDDSLHCNHLAYLFSGPSRPSRYICCLLSRLPRLWRLYQNCTSRRRAVSLVPNAHPHPSTIRRTMDQPFSSLDWLCQFGGISQEISVWRFRFCVVWSLCQHIPTHTSTCFTLHDCDICKLDLVPIA